MQRFLFAGRLARRCRATNFKKEIHCRSRHVVFLHNGGLCQSAGEGKSEVHSDEVNVSSFRVLDMKNVDLKHPYAATSKSSEEESTEEYTTESDTTEDTEDILESSEEDTTESSEVEDATEVEDAKAKGDRQLELEGMEESVDDSEVAIAEQEMVPDQLVLIAETSSESEPEESPEPKTSVLHKLTIRQVAKILKKLRAIDLKILNVQARCQWTDYMVFVTGRSTRHIRGMADSIVYAVKKRSTIDNHMLFPTVEGRDCQDWMVVDCGEIIVHVFSEEARAHYNLERKWGGVEVPEEEYSPRHEEDEEEDDDDLKEDSSEYTKSKKKKKKTKKQKMAAAKVARSQASVPENIVIPC